MRRHVAWLVLAAACDAATSPAGPIDAASVGVQAMVTVSVDSLPTLAIEGPERPLGLRVLADGRPVRGVQVVLGPCFSDPGCAVRVVMSAPGFPNSAFTDADGRAAFRLLPVGPRAGEVPVGVTVFGLVRPTPPSDTVALTVGPGAPVRIAPARPVLRWAADSALVLTPGDTVSLSIVTDRFGNAVTLPSATRRFSVDDPSVALVDSTGRVRIVGRGTTIVRATIGTITTATSITGDGAAIAAIIAQDSGSSPRPAPPLLLGSAGGGWLLTGATDVWRWTTSGFVAAAPLTRSRFTIGALALVMRAGHLVVSQRDSIGVRVSRWTAGGARAEASLPVADALYGNLANHADTALVFVKRTTTDSVAIYRWIDGWSEWRETTPITMRGLWTTAVTPEGTRWLAGYRPGTAGGVDCVVWRAQRPGEIAWDGEQEQCAWRRIRVVPTRETSPDGLAAEVVLQNGSSAFVRLAPDGRVTADQPPRCVRRADDPNDVAWCGARELAVVQRGGVTQRLLDTATTAAFQRLTSAWRAPSGEVFATRQLVYSQGRSASELVQVVRYSMP